MIGGSNFRGSTEESSKRLALNVEAAKREAASTQVITPKRATFRAFAAAYLRDHARLHKRDKGERDEMVIDNLNEVLGDRDLREITAHDIEKWRQKRLTQTWSVPGQVKPAKSISPGTVNRELNVLKGILTKAVEWGYLRISPAKTVKPLRVNNQRTRILTPVEAARLVQACRGRFKALVVLALITGARRGELLDLKWTEVGEKELTFIETKNGTMRRIPMTPNMREVFKSKHLSRQHDYVFANPATGDKYASIRKNFERALERAKIRTGDVSFHTLRHSAISRMIHEGFDDHSIREIVGHSSLKMLERYTHPTQERKAAALERGAAQFSSFLAHEDAGPEEDE